MKPLLPTDPPRVGPYRLLARLGAGGMGQVFLGHSRSGRTVAVKLVRPDLAEDLRFRLRFAREVRAARRVGGFYTAQVVDADTTAEQPWMATSYVPGPSLWEAVNRHGPLPADTVLAIGAGLAEALAAIHECEVIHRDLKPGNVLLSDDGPRIIDFGIARALDAASGLTGAEAIGTPAFMSPEQIRGREAGPASDVFSLCVTLAYAATGRSPFGEGLTEAVIYRVVHDEPDLTGIPPELVPLIEVGLAKDPDHRPGVNAVLDYCASRSHSAALRLPTEVTALITQRVAESRAFLTAETAPRRSQPLLIPRPPAAGHPRSQTDESHARQVLLARLALAMRRVQARSVPRLPGSLSPTVGSPVGPSSPPAAPGQSPGTADTPRQTGRQRPSGRRTQGLVRVRRTVTVLGLLIALVLLIMLASASDASADETDDPMANHRVSVRDVVRAGMWSVEDVRCRFAASS